PAYVTLEPCPHDGRTPPCADALIAAGVRRVVVSLEDPDPRVAGRGFARLRAAGLDVEVGPGATSARRSLAPYLHHRRTGRAWCLVKTAMSLDAKTAAADGSSRWITGVAARADAHRLRAESQAVVIGAGTALADRPSLTARDVDRPIDRQPLRVLLDAHGRAPAAVPGALLAAGLVDRLVAYVSPKVLGPGGLPAFRAPDVDTVVDAEAWRLLSATPIDDDVRLEYEPEDG